MYQVYAPALAHYDAVIIFSKAQRDLLIRLGVPSAKIVVIPNGVDTNKYCPGPSPLKTELKADHIFVYQGRIAIEKNVESLLKAWRQVHRPTSAKLVIVGDGPLSNALMPTYGPEQNVLWLGSISDEQRRIEILQGADVFILPSFVEGLSLSLLEAMACGLACLATDAGADGEVLDGGAGVILNPQRVRSELRTLIPLMISQPEIVQLLGQKARQRALKSYCLSNNIDQLEAFYNRILEGAKPPSTLRSPVELRR